MSSNQNGSTNVDTILTLDWSRLSRLDTEKLYWPSYWARELKREVACPNFAKVVIEKSDKARTMVKNCEFNVSYGESERETIEIMMPDSPAEDAPVQVFYHGGLWSDCRKEDHVLHGPPFVKRGAILASVGYSLCPKVTVADIVKQCEEAIVFLAKRFPKSRGFYISGHSCGGQLTMMMLGVDWTKHQLPADLIKGAVPLSGSFDVRPYTNTSDQDNLKLTLAEAWELTPLNPSVVQRVSKYSKHVNICLVHGDHDPPTAKQQGNDLYQMLVDAGLKCRLVELKDMDHFEVYYDMDDEQHGATKVLLDIMCLKD